MQEGAKFHINVGKEGTFDQKGVFRLEVFCPTDVIGFFSVSSKRGESRLRDEGMLSSSNPLVFLFVLQLNLSAIHFS